VLYDESEEPEVLVWGTSGGHCQRVTCIPAKMESGKEPPYCPGPWALVGTVFQRRSSSFLDLCWCLLGPTLCFSASLLLS
jgi:hypothetical protein